MAVTGQVSLAGETFNIVIAILSASMVVRRLNERRAGIAGLPLSRGGSPLWLWIVFLAWGGGSLILLLVMVALGKTRLTL